MFTLYYMQIMAFVTPLRPDICEMLDKSPRNIMQRLKGVAALYHQVKLDEAWESHQLKRKGRPAYKAEHGIEPLARRMRRCAIAECSKVKALKASQQQIFRRWFDSAAWLRKKN